MKTQLRHRRSSKILLVLAAVLTVTVFVGAACGTSKSGNTEQPSDIHAGEMIHEEGNGHDEVEAVREHEAGHDDDEVAPEHHATHGDAELAHEEEADDGHEAAVIEGAREITLTATDYAIVPETITVKLGEPVTIVLKNEGVVEHDVEVAAFGLHVHTPGGAVERGSFVPDKAGTFQFACEIPGHRELGMVGELVVTE